MRRSVLFPSIEEVWEQRSLVFNSYVNLGTIRLTQLLCHSSKRVCFAICGPRDFLEYNFWDPLYQLNSLLMVFHQFWFEYLIFSCNLIYNQLRVSIYPDFLDI